MEDNAPVHIHYYHNISRERLGYRKLVWPTNSPDLNPIETIWTELKDKLRDQIGPRMTTRDIRRVLEQVKPLSPSYFFYTTFVCLVSTKSIQILRSIPGLSSQLVCILHYQYRTVLL